MSKDYEKWAEEGFVGGSKEELREAAEVYCIKLHPNCSEATIRQRLCDAAGKVAPNVENTPDISKLTSTAFPDEMPGINGIGRWGGRRHTVTISQPSGDKTKFLPIGWEGEFLYVKFGTKTHLPEPHYNILMDAKVRSFTIEYKEVAKGVRVREQIDEEYPAFSVADHGITPGTEHLPGSVLEWYQQLSQKKDHFKRFRKERLEEIYGELWGHAPKEGNHPWSHDKLRRETLRFLGNDFVKAAFADEMEDEAA